jgi:hypothetical protein
MENIQLEQWQHTVETAIEQAMSSAITAAEESGTYAGSQVPVSVFRNIVEGIV